MNKKLVYIAVGLGALYLFVKAKKMAEETAAKLQPPPAASVNGTPLSQFTRG